ncbi:heterokaryon incompatibility protein-domain-containing protein, partial [Cercophora newfieldiana]
LATTRASREAHLAGIQYMDLPKTLQDAVDVTRALQVPYLWVDSLCIIQDDVDGRDWRIESAKMDRIYEGSFLTISATSAQAVTEGFLGQRIVIASEPETTTPKTRHRHDAVIPEDSDEANLRQYPLLSRAWTFQERLLSTRTLHFLPHETIFECRSDMWCECGGSRADQLWKKGKVRGSVYNRAAAGAFRGDIYRGPSEVWQLLIQQYSKRRLSKWEDRLLALSGIARKFSKQFGMNATGAYHAGLWEVDILWHVLW